MSRIFVLVIALFILASCRTDSLPQETIEASLRQQSTQLPLSTSSPTLTATPTARATATATTTPTPTPTPTPTALPLIISRGLADIRTGTPVPDSNARCGLVDILDFPLNPPDGIGVARGGQDFGRYRERYGSYHAGEDWWSGRGRSSFGKPVYSIGHGQVTYAEPNGWGRDQGVVIVRHIFADGQSFLSFYGHLDPPSVVLEAGDCVNRGQEVGKIGKPRTAPHLHFELRTLMPYEPGPGYWAEDPVLAGWLPPSQTIWTNRISNSPGVLWTQPVTGKGRIGLGEARPGIFAAIEESGLIGIDIASGEELWQLNTSLEVRNAAIDLKRPLLYVADRTGGLEAFSFISPDDSDSSILPQPDQDPWWSIDLENIGQQTLMPLADGGLIVSTRQTIASISDAGEILWEEDGIGSPQDWVSHAGGLILTTGGRDGRIWTITDTGPDPWKISLTGRLVAQDGLILLYDGRGVYRLDPEEKTADLLFPLPRSFLGLGDMIPLADGGILLHHREVNDNTLILFESDGSIRWQRSIRGQLSREVSLISDDGKVYLAAEAEENSISEMTVYQLDLLEPSLQLLFRGGTRDSMPDESGIFTGGDGLLLINIGGGNLTSLDPEVAASEMARTSN